MSEISQGREHRPTPEKITDLAAEVVHGKIRLPKFQRDFVWSRDQVLDLMDSISRNYPIGSLLLWKSRSNLVSDSNIAGLSVESREDEDDGGTVYLLDGCQRMSVITGALYWEPGDPNSYWNIVYDLQDQEFLHRVDRYDPPSHQIPLNLVPKAPDFFRRISKLPEPLQERGMTLLDRFTSYEVAVVTLRRTRLSEIGRIFERINTRGTPLTTMELLRASTWANDFDLFDEIDRVRDALKSKHYGKIDRNLLLRAVAAAAGLGFSKADIEGLAHVALGDFRRAIEQTEQAAKLAVDFLWTEIGTPTANDLPYPVQLAVVIEIFRQVPKPTRQQFGEIRSWFWRTMLSGYYENWTAGKMKADYDAVKAFAGGAKTVRVDTPALSTSLWTNVQYNRGTARTKALALMLAAAGPVDLRSGQRIDPGKSLAPGNDMQYHHFFPKAWLTRNGTSAADANVLADIVMLTAISNNAIDDHQPSAYLQSEIDFIGEAAMRRRLKTLVVSDRAFDAAMQDDYRAFISIRANDLLAWATDLITGEPSARGVEPSGPETSDSALTGLDDTVLDDLAEVEDDTED